MMQVRVPVRSRFVDVRGINYHVLEWGDAAAPPLVMLHGWMDVAASFQFLVDALEGRWHVIAPDWQGFGRTAWRRDGYWYQDYVADLDFLLRALLPDDRAHLIGHSLGANVAMIYAGVRASRVGSVIALDGFGIPAEDPAVAPAKMAAWLDALAQPPMLAPYPDLAAVASRLQKNNPQLARDQAEFLAGEWAQALPDGSVRLRADPRHKLPFPTVYRMEEIEAVWRGIEVPVLWVEAAESHISKWLAGGADNPDADADAEIARRMRNVPQATRVTVADAGHMLHHDQPQAVAAIVEKFVGDVIARS